MRIVLIEPSIEGCSIMMSEGSGLYRIYLRSEGRRQACSQLYMVHMVENEAQRKENKLSYLVIDAYFSLERDMYCLANLRGPCCNTTRQEIEWRS